MPCISLDDFCLPLVSEGNYAEGSVLGEEAVVTSASKIAVSSDYGECGTVRRPLAVLCGSRTGSLSGFCKCRQLAGGRKACPGSLGFPGVKQRP